MYEQRKECYLREISRLTDLSTSSVSRHLDKFKSNDIVNERKSGRELMYKLNLNNPLCRKLLEIIEIRKTQDFKKRFPKLSLIFEDIVEMLKKKSINITVFGSIAKETFSEKSDIDILLISETKQEFVEAIKNINIEYNKDLSIIDFTRSEFEKKKTEPIVGQIIKNHLVLHGYEYFVKEMIYYE